MAQICTTVEQSKKLIELGLDTKTADMSWDSIYDESHLMSDYKMSLIPYKYSSSICIPAWSLSALLDFLPSNIKTSNKFGTYTYKLDLRKYDITDDVNMYQIAYGSPKDINHSWKDMINTSEREDLLDVVFEMVCWLLENKKL